MCKLGGVYPVEGGCMPGRPLVATATLATFATVRLVNNHARRTLIMINVQQL